MNMNEFMAEAAEVSETTESSALNEQMEDLRLQMEAAQTAGDTEAANYYKFQMEKLGQETAYSENESSAQQDTTHTLESNNGDSSEKQEPSFGCASATNVRHTTGSRMIGQAKALEREAHSLDSKGLSSEANSKLRKARNLRAEGEKLMSS